MKVSIQRVLIVVPVFMLVMAGILVGVDSLTVQSATAPTGKVQTAPPQAVVASPAPSPRPLPTAQPAPATPSPRVTVAATRGGNTLTIPSIGLVASIVNVGLTSSNAIDVPAGPQVGYWTGSAVPGMPGAVFLDGHVDGILAHLNRVAVGQAFSMNYGGQTLQYQVAHTETVALAGIDMNRALSTYVGAREGVNIMTCAGTYVPSMGTYDQRFVVYAVRI